MTLAGRGAWLMKPESLAARSSALNVRNHAQCVNRLSKSTWGAFFVPWKQKGGEKLKPSSIELWEDRQE